MDGLWGDGRSVEEGLGARAVLERPGLVILAFWVFFEEKMLSMSRKHHLRLSTGQSSSCTAVAGPGVRMRYSPALPVSQVEAVMLPWSV
ncbi:hypothetical protein Mtai_v1c00670 [Meiothermus taiwanensis WR-220]|jgi:hypothetical protein|uniref:Uncharacterized protein n=2 Tax=Meiothermus taiwanensis TaxID=172827 RepID=A0A399E5K2_9DEIN|nr:hypothetical protein Mtai_v1c00670 [Meiothermus taiwanensis WR-220]RIH77541.1 hypothetical protein Mcate_01275 [Meiothermus taiwanensis]